METRRIKKPKSPTGVGTSFVEVKEEPVDEHGNISEPICVEGYHFFSSENVNKHSSPLQQKAPESKSCKTYYKRSRATQVNAEDIDVINVKSLDFSNIQAENKPIQPIGTEAIIPQCRFCLRRVSRANLKIILMKHKTKALAAFQIRVFPNDAYPFACSNCLNLIDIFLDFKSSVTKARNLLLNKRMHLESNGWDDLTNIEAFSQCKAAVERHRIQIDTIYDEQMAREDRRNVSILEPKMELSVDDQEKNNVIHREQCSDTAADNLIDDSVVEFGLDSDINEVENILRSNTVDTITDQEIDLNTEITYNQGPEESSSNSYGNHSRIDPSYDKDNQPLAKRRKRKILKYSTDSEQGFEDEDYNPTEHDETYDDEHKSSSLVDTSKKSKTSSDSDQSTDDEVYISEDNDFTAKRKVSCSQKASKSKEKKSRKPRKKRESTLNRPPDYKPPSILPVLCDLCGEKVRPETIEGHRNRHLGIKPYTCPVDGCGWTFYGRANMSTHMRRMHPENGVPSQKCDVCGKYIRGKPGILNEHKKLHFLKEKSYVCPVCGKGFTLNRYLRQHSIIHTGLFPYECSYCGKKFNNKWSMKTHEKNMHEKKNQAPTSYDPDPMMEDAASGQSYA